MKDIAILIIPDVHGRDFWRDAVMNNLDKEIIFLGDYLDPYPHENISKERAIEVFEEILALARDNKNITLLLGNHDCSYALSPQICECRHDWNNHNKIAKLFEDNFGFFDLAKEKIINGKRFFFSHAGLHRIWYKADRYVFGERFKPTAKAFNSLLHSDDNRTRGSLVSALSEYSYYRGGYESYGSMVWADIREFVLPRTTKNSEKKIQIVGHTSLKQAIKVNNNMYCLDCLKSFYIDDKGVVRYYDTDEEVTLSPN